MDEVVKQKNKKEPSEDKVLAGNLLTQKEKRKIIILGVVSFVIIAIALSVALAFSGNREKSDLKRTSQGLFFNSSNEFGTVINNPYTLGAKYRTSVGEPFIEKLPDQQILSFNKEGNQIYDTPNTDSLVKEASNILSSFMQRAYLQPEYFENDPAFKSLKEVCTEGFVKNNLSTDKGLNNLSMGPEGYKQIKSVPFVKGTITCVIIDYDGDQIKKVSVGFVLKADLVYNKDDSLKRLTINGDLGIDWNQKKVSSLEYTRSCHSITEPEKQEENISQ